VSGLADLTVPISDIVFALHPADSPTIDTTVRLDGQPTVRANVVQIDVSKPDFDRRRNAAETPDADDPPIDVLFEVVNSVLHRLRSLLRSPVVHPITKRGAIWRLEFLTDTEERVPEEKGKFKARNCVGFSAQLSGLAAVHWQAVISLPRDYRPKAWESLLLEAEAHLPDVVPAIVLAAAAIEVLIGNALATLAPTQQTASDLWQFINDRGGDYRKQPSVAEEFDPLLRALTGRSLKDETELWAAFENLRNARNALMHTGAIVIGKRRAPVTREEAYVLVGRAKEIACWIEALLPPGARRPAEVFCQLDVLHRLLMNRTTSPMMVTNIDLAQTTPATHCIVTGEGGPDPDTQPGG
jgi:hypothetical protein